MQTGDSLSGNWFESTYRVGGTISGRNTGREINARAEGDTFTALLTVKTNGRRQVFLMESPGAKVSQVSINLSQAPKRSQSEGSSRPFGWSGDPGRARRAGRGRRTFSINPTARA